MSPDAINACFEAGGALFLCLNVARIRRDRTVRGVSLWPTAWWSAWGVWNVYYYSALAQPASFWAGVAVVIVNTVWLAHALAYARRERLGLARRVLQ